MTETEQWPSRFSDKINRKKKPHDVERIDGIVERVMKGILEKEEQ